MLAGRDDLLAEAQFALAAGPRHPGFTSMLLGARGTGKTTAASQIIDDAQTAGWRICQTDALAPGTGEPPLHDVLADNAERHIADINPPRRYRKSRRAAKIGPMKWEWARNSDDHSQIVRRLQRSLDDLVALTLSEGGTGVLLAIDEFHNVQIPEASVIASAVQHLTKIQEKPVAFLGVGLSYLEDTLLSEKSFTFFQRCQRHRIRNLEIADAKRCLREPLTENGVVIDNRQLCRAAGATNGHPYAVQSIGFHLWSSMGASRRITDAGLSAAIAAMNNDMHENVMAPTWTRLTGAQKDFLAAILPDGTQARISDIANRLGISASAANARRQRLLGEGAITAAGRGKVAFSNHRLFEVANEHQAQKSSWRTHDEWDDNAATTLEIKAAPEPSVPKQVCDAWMPLAQCRCALSDGHAGPHRRNPRSKNA